MRAIVEFAKDLAEPFLTGEINPAFQAGQQASTAIREGTATVGDALLDVGELGLGLLGLGLGPAAGTAAKAGARGVARLGRRTLRPSANADRVARAIGTEAERVASTGPLRRVVEVVESAGERITPEARRKLLSVEGKRDLRQAIPNAAQRERIIRMIEQGAGGQLIKRALQVGALGAGGRAVSELF